MGAGDDDKALVTRISETSDKVKGVFAQWWALTTSDRRPPADPSRLITVDKLPIYEDETIVRKYDFLPEEPLPLQREFATLRKAFTTEYERVVSRFAFVDTAVTHTGEAVQKVNRYVNDEWTVLPKAAAITVGGMAGFVLGLKRGRVGRLFTTAAGLGTMAAFCYPHETVAFGRSSAAITQKQWDDFQKSPEPPSQKFDFSPPK